MEQRLIRRAYTVRVASELLGVTKTAVRARIERGTLDSWSGELTDLQETVVSADQVDAELGDNQPETPMSTIWVNVNENHADAFTVVPPEYVSEFDELQRQYDRLVLDAHDSQLRSDEAITKWKTKFERIVESLKSAAAALEIDA